MNYRNRLLTSLLAAFAAVGATSPASARLASHSVPPESFLDYHVDTVPQLTFEVAYDKAVQGRLAHHFHLSGPAMSAYVHDNLVLLHLRAPLHTRVYCVSPRGREFFVLMTLKTGTPVFALRRTGRPVLRLVCGNPLVGSLPAVPKKIAAAKPAARAVVKPLVKTLVKPTQMALISPDTASADVVPAAWSVPDVATSGSSVFFTSAAASGAGWLGLLPVAGLAALFPTHHAGGDTQGASPSDVSLTTPNSVTPLVPIGGGTGDTPGGSASNAPLGLFPAPPAGPTSGPTPAPEPGPGWVFVLGGFGVGALALRKRRSGSR